MKLAPASSLAIRLVSFLIACFCPILLPAQTDIWLGGAGNWSNGAMWSSGVPGNTSNVFIDNGNAKVSPVTLDIQTSVNNLTIDSDDSLSFNNGTNLAINGSSISNAGTISLNSDGSGTYLLITNGATLSGAGTVTMSNNSQNYVDGNSGAVLTNKSTIQGGGQIGDHITLANQGTINANVSGAVLAVTDDSNGADTNTGIMEATNGGILVLESTGIGNYNNTGGTIEAIGTGSQVQFGGYGTSITGGTLTTRSGGTFVDSRSCYLTGVTNAGTFNVQNGAYLNLPGDLTNHGTININSTGGYTVMLLNNVNATLYGKGRVILTNTPSSGIDGNGGLVLTNQSTIQGGGQIGPHFTFLNNGTLHVPAANTMNITAPFVNFSGTTLSGGTYVVSGKLVITNANIVTNSAKVTLSGAKAQITDQNGTNALGNFATNAKVASFSLMSGNLLTTSGSISNAGKLKVGPKSGLQAGSGSYTQTAGQTTVDGVLTAPAGVGIQAGKLYGKGSIVATVVSDGLVTAGDSTSKAGQLSMSTYTQNAGASLNIQIGGTTVGTQYSQLAVSNGVKLNGTLNVKLISNFVPAIGNTFTILTGSAITGQFATVNLPTLSGAHFVINYNPTNVTLTVVSG